MSNPFAAVAITKHGVEMMRDLGARFPGTDVYYMAKFARGDEEELGIQMFEGSVRLILGDLFKRYNGIILCISLGAVVRMIAPLLVDKKVDPGVIVIDDRGEHVISVLSGHLGGANELTRQVAGVLGARPVITTASDVQGTIPVDLFGRELGWTIDSFDQATPVSAAVVNEEPVALIQETGEKNWWRYDKPIPSHIQIYSSTAEASSASFSAALVITDRLLDETEQARYMSNGVLYRPKSLVVGIGCNRGTPMEELEEALLETLQELKLSMNSVRNLATIDLKKDEEGLLALCAKYGWELTVYTPAELNTVTLPHPSETVYKYTGAYGVCEPACLLSSGADGWLLEKKKSGNLTLSIARIPFPDEPNSVSANDVNGGNSANDGNSLNGRNSLNNRNSTNGQSDVTQATNVINTTNAIDATSAMKTDDKQLEERT